MKYLNSEHKDFYIQNIQKTNSHEDPFRKALFYALGLTKETRAHITCLYNFNDRCIEFDGLHEGWQTGTSIRITRLAFNLYNGYCGEIDDEKDVNDDYCRYTPYNLFDCALMIYMFEAVKLLYPCYAIE